MANNLGLRIRKLSVVVSIQMCNRFVYLHKKFVSAQDAEQDVRERQASRNI